MLTIGQSFDEENHLVQGKITFDYLFYLTVKYLLLAVNHRKEIAWRI